MLDLLGHIPLPILIALGAAATYFAWRYTGRNGAVIAAGLTALLAMFRMGRTAEKEEREVKDTKRSLDVIREAGDARREVRESIHTAEDVRADDGFRRPETDEITDEQWAAIRKATDKFQSTEGGTLVSGTPWPAEPAPPSQPVDPTLRADDGFRRK